jgi:hypothetical protein
VSLKASWYLRSLYVMPWLFLCVVIVAAGESIAVVEPAVVAVAVVAAAVGIRSLRIGVAVRGDVLTVRNFWLTYQIVASSVVSIERAMRMGWFTAIGGPNSVVVVRLASGAGVPVVASTFGRLLNRRSGRAVERVVAQIQVSA